MKLQQGKGRPTCKATSPKFFTDTVERKKLKMRHFIQIVTYISLLAFPTFLTAEQVGRYIAIERIVINDIITVPAGAEVNFLGVIDVTRSNSPSGKLATFTYGDRVLNADASLFYSQDNDQNVTVYPARTFDSGSSASMCSTLVQKVHDEVLEFADDGYQKYFELTSNDKVVSSPT